MLLPLLLVFGFVRQAKGSEAKLPSSTIHYYTGDTFAIYEPWNISGKMTFVFRTSSQRGLLFYQDDSKYAYMKLQVKQNGLEMEITLPGGLCTRKRIQIQGAFADAKWHQVLLEGRPDVFNLSVDSRFSETIRCMQDSPSYHFNELYVRSFPKLVELGQSLVDPKAFLNEYFQRGFNGCLGRFQYSAAGKTLLRDAEIRSANITVCGDYCECSNCCQEMPKSSTDPKSEMPTKSPGLPTAYRTESSNTATQVGSVQTTCVESTESFRQVHDSTNGVVSARNLTQQTRISALYGSRTVSQSSSTRGSAPHFEYRDGKPAAASWISPSAVSSNVQAWRLPASSQVPETTDNNKASSANESSLYSFVFFVAMFASASV